jgi:hypothetical protein
MVNHPTIGLVDVFAAAIPTLTFAPGVHINYAETVLPMRDGLPKLKDFPAGIWRFRRGNRRVGASSDRRPGNVANAIAACRSPRCFSCMSTKRAKPRRFSPQSSTTIGGMKTLAIISLLALLTISGAAYTDQLLTSGHQTTQRVN